MRFLRYRGCSLVVVDGVFQLAQVSELVGAYVGVLDHVLAGVTDSGAAGFDFARLTGESDVYLLLEVGSPRREGTIGLPAESIPKALPQ